MYKTGRYFLNGGSALSATPFQYKIGHMLKEIWPYLVSLIQMPCIIIQCNMLCSLKKEGPFMHKINVHNPPVLSSSISSIFNYKERHVA